MTSCTIQKRLFNKGYSIEWHKKFDSKHEEKKNIVREKNNQALPFINEIPLTADIQEPDSTTIVEETATDYSLPAISHETQDHVITSKKKRSQINLNLGFNNQVIKKNEPNPPDEDIRSFGVELAKVTLDFKHIGILVSLLLLSILFTFLASIITVAVLQQTFTLLAAITLVSFMVFACYILAFVFVGFCCLLVYWIANLIYKRRLRKWYDSVYSLDEATLDPTSN